MPRFFFWVRARWQAWFALPPWLLLVLALLAAANLARLDHRPLGPDRPVDFRPCYVGQWVLRHGHDPYQDANIRWGWRQLVAQESLPSHNSPGLPQQGFIYPPWGAAFLGLVLGPLPYALAWRLWYGVVLLSLGLICWTTSRVLARLQAPRLTAADLLLAALALKGTAIALLNGQCSFPALALATGAWWAAEARRPGWAGLLLGLASFKITVALPVLGYLLWRRQWRALAGAAAVGLGLLALYWQWAAQPLAYLHSYQQLLAWVQADVLSPHHPSYPLNQAMIIQFGLSNLLEFWQRGGQHWAHWASLLLAAATAARVLTLGRAATPLYVLLLLQLLGLLFTYHVVYDALLLLPLLAYGRVWPARVQAGLLLAAAAWVLPINGVLDRLGAPPAWQWLYFALPISALGLLLGLLWLGPAPRRPAPAAA